MTEILKKLQFFFFMGNAVIVILGFGFVFEYASVSNSIVPLIIIIILIYSALANPKEDFQHLSIYSIGILYYSSLIYSAIGDMIQYHYFKIFDIVYPLSLIVGFSFMIYFAKKSSKL